MAPHWQASDEELLAALGESQTELNAVWSRMLEVVAEVDARGIALKKGYRDAAGLLRDAQNVRFATAKARVRAAGAVVARRTVSGEELPAELPGVAAVVAEAVVTEEHVRVIQEVLAMVPPDLAEHRPALEAELAEHARTFDPDAVGKLGKRAVAMLDPDGPRPRLGDPVRTQLRFSERGKGFDLRGWLSQDDAAVVRTALSPLSKPAPAADGARDPRTAAERLGDGLVELAKRALDDGTLPGEGGQRPHVTVTVPLAVLMSGLGAGLLEFGAGTLCAAVSAEQARRWACGADVAHRARRGGRATRRGRTRRLVSRAIRRALEQRDVGCAFPGCGCPAAWTEAHHVRHWADHGVTALGNLVLLCSRHHGVVHEGEWSITMEDDGFPLFHPPPWVFGGPRRNLLHRPDLIAQALSSTGALARI